MRSASQEMPSEAPRAARSRRDRAVLRPPRLHAARASRSAGDLFGLLDRVSQALGVMTHHILEQGGVVGDFHGDAAMGFWGWPIAQPDAVERACRAALGIRAAFAAADGLADFRVGIGIASGRAVAGKIGTVDQVKVTVFGPVVNLASRLETMTRQLRASILIDPPTAAVIRATVPREICRVRRLAHVRPVGLSAPLEVSELLPPLPLGEGSRASRRGSLTDEHLASYEAALDRLPSPRLAAGPQAPARRPARRPGQGLPHHLHRPARPHAAAQLGRLDSARREVKPRRASVV